MLVVHLCSLCALSPSQERVTRKHIVCVGRVLTKQIPCMQGGGNTSVSLVNVLESIVEVRSTSGDGNLGGEDFVQRLVEYFASELQLQFNKDVRFYTKSLRR